uniref:Putative neurotoxin LTDF 15-01 n=1 Tax=Dolomedes fimbriatus TaxID=1432569 RepID=A0A0K1D8X3_9ARAC|nr:putative neurotoxin LTDF 15-01 [Dolomedes fimbriatus]
MLQTLYISLFFGCTFLLLDTNAYTYIQPLNTESGFCEGPGFKVAVGEEGYSTDESCEKILCHHGSREVFGCGKVIPPSDPQCHMVRESGHHPDCCLQVRCT